MGGFLIQNSNSKSGFKIRGKLGDMHGHTVNSWKESLPEIVKYYTMENMEYG